MSDFVRSVAPLVLSCEGGGMTGSLVFNRSANPAVTGDLHWKVPAGVVRQLTSGVDHGVICRRGAGSSAGRMAPNRTINRSFFGVVLRGNGANAGRGNLMDSNAIRTVTLTTEEQN